MGGSQIQTKLTIRSPHDSDEHHSSHEDVEEREPPAKEQQVKDIPTRQRGPCRTKGTRSPLSLPSAQIHTATTQGCPQGHPPPEPLMTLRSE